MPEGGHWAVVMETPHIPLHVDPTPRFFQRKALRQRYRPSLQAQKTHTHKRFSPECLTFAFTRLRRPLQRQQDSTSRQTSAADERSRKDAENNTAVDFHNTPLPTHIHLDSQRPADRLSTEGNSPLKDSIRGSIRALRGKS